MKQIILITIVLSLFLLSGCGRVTEAIVQSQPTQAEVESFFEDWKCGPDNPTFEDEHNCSEYLRHHSALIRGKITIVVPEESDLYIYTPFDYLGYYPIDGEKHYYVSVNTKDNGPLVYNPINGEYVGDYYDLMLDMGCYEVSLGDTIGIGSISTTANLLEYLINKEKIPASTLAGHFHDTHGQALANIRIALKYGIRTFDSSVSGLGGCPYADGLSSGNVATEDVLYMLNELGLETGVNINKILEASKYIDSVLGRTVKRNI